MKKVLMILTAILLSIGLAACGSQGSEEAASGGGEEAGSKKLSKVGLTVMTLDNPYFVAFKNSLEAEAEKEGFEALVNSADFDLAKQQSQIENFISKGVDVILINAVDSQGIAGGVQQAVAAGIPVIAVDVGADGGTTATVMSDNYQAGVLAGEYLAERLGGKGNVVLLNGNPITSIFDRVDGFKEAIAKYPDIKIVAEQNGELNRDKSYSVMENILSSNPVGEIDAVYGVNDPTAIGGYLAAKAADRTELFFVGVDGSQDAIDFIKKDDMFGFTAAQHPEQEIVEAIKLAKDLLAGKEVKEEILVPVDPVSKDNVDTFKPEF
ncbi:substrate-binding domain-containing protein [Metabacillus bambusae]|uniref:Substrate-binding domain-containing protein n=1 Tax=Metabacillus bambusae TaxID=2795218 RepID=A0ABS3N1A1_9BACI|nr:substrate-binding domain-containing protein [Metabacillus bambusae]MBO1511840.1 substrate-binding domain-containing protein [Metabacillus bambusae]